MLLILGALVVGVVLGLGWAQWRSNRHEDLADVDALQAAAKLNQLRMQLESLNQTLEKAYSERDQALQGRAAELSVAKVESKHKVAELVRNHAELALEIDRNMEHMGEQVRLMMSVVHKRTNRMIMMVGNAAGGVKFRGNNAYLCDCKPQDRVIVINYYYDFLWLWL